MKRYAFRIEDPIEEAARIILLQEFKRMVRKEQPVLQGVEGEEIHRMRVSCRRMRAVFAVLEPFFRKRASRRFEGFVRRTGRSLGRVRDLELFSEDLGRFLSRERDGRAVGESSVPVIPFLAAALEGERGRLRTWLISGEYTEEKRIFRRELEKGISSWFRGKTAGPGRNRFRYVFPPVVLRSYQEILSFRESLDAAEVSHEFFHILRIRTKILRYAMEFADSALSGSFRGVLRPVIRLQDRLGALQDCVSAAARVREFLEGEGAELFRDPLVCAYVAEKRSLQAGLAAGIPSLWRGLTEESYRKKLTELLTGFY